MMKEYFKKIRTWILTHKLLTVITVLLILGLILYLFLRGRKGVLVPPTVPTPTAFVVSRLAPPTIYPLPGDLQAAGTKNAITLSFEKAVDLSTVTITSEPSLTFKVATLADFPRNVVFYPLTPWTDGITYKIKIQKGIMSLDGTQRLNEEINLEYKVIPFPLPNYNSERGV